MAIGLRIARKEKFRKNDYAAIFLGEIKGGKLFFNLQFRTNQTIDLRSCCSSDSHEEIE